MVDLDSSSALRQTLEAWRRSFKPPTTICHSSLGWPRPQGLCIEWHEAPCDSSHRDVTARGVSLAVNPCTSTPTAGHVTLESHGALPRVSVSVRARHGEGDDGVRPPHGVFGVIIVALIFSKVHKHLKRQEKRV